MTVSYELFEQFPGWNAGFFRSLLLIRLLQQATTCCGSILAGDPEYVLCASNAIIRCKCAASPKAEQGLKCGHGPSSAIMAEDEFIEITLELVAAYPVVSSDQPLLQIANRAVCQGYRGLRAFAQVGLQWLVSWHMPEASLLQTGEALESVRIYR